MDEIELYMEIQRLDGVENPTRLPDKRHWRLHLKENTPVNPTAVFELPTKSEQTKTFLSEAWRYMDPRIFEGLQTSRRLKSTQLSQEDIDEAVRMGKFERCDRAEISGIKIPYGTHGVNVFAVPELKGRRRLITEPLINAVINRHTVPHVSYPSRLARRQSLRYARYMLQIDFEAFYDAIPIPVEIRNNFLFRKGEQYYRLCTLPTGARWSVAVGQAITWTVVDIDTPVIIHTMIDNIMIAAEEGQEAEFLKAVRVVVDRIRRVNLMTSPNREELETASDDDLLSQASAPNVFLGEVYAWDGHERWVRNSNKTIAKMTLAMRAENFSCRTFVSLISLILYAIHTTGINPAGAYHLLRAYRGVYRTVTAGVDWDSSLRYLDPKVHSKMVELGHRLVANDWWRIADVIAPTYDNDYYDYIAVTDASYGGWGAYVRRKDDGSVTAYQQKWERGEIETQPAYQPEKVRSAGFFDAQHSAHAEPRAAQLLLRQLVREGMPDHSRVALVTDHIAIVHAQRRTNGFGGIGRGYTLNKLFEYVHDLLFHHDIQVTFFHLSGKVNPADTISRTFGDNADHGGVFVFPAPNTQIPLLCSTYSPVCEKLTFKQGHTSQK